MPRFKAHRIMELIINYISIIGAFAFAVSGAITAMNKRFDPFGVLIIAFVSAVGGGTLRDVLITEKSVFWLVEPSYIYFILGGTLFAILFKNKLNSLYKPLLFFDAIGLGLFTITGVQIGLEFELSAVNCIILGTLTGAFGGVVRDILVNEVPVIFKQEIYATVSILGGALYLIFNKLGMLHPYLQIIPVLAIILLRLVVIKYNISLPSLYKKEDA